MSIYRRYLYLYLLADSAIAELSILKKAIDPIVKKSHSGKSKFINNTFLHRTEFYDGKNVVNIKSLTSKKYYECLLNKKSEEHYSQKMWENALQIQPGLKGWAEIYRRKVKNILYKKLSEFNFKVLNKILYTGYVINKWNVNVSKYCKFCKQVETPQHLIFECCRSQYIWKFYSKICKSNITWKDIVIGYNENCAGNIAKNIITSSAAYSIYKCWVICQNEENDYCDYKLFNSVRINVIKLLKLYASISKRMHVKQILDSYVNTMCLY